MKIYQQLEQIYKFRIFSNEEITPYLIKLSRLGKIDEPKKTAMFTIILDKLGQMEDDAESREAELLQRVDRKLSYIRQVDGGTGTGGGGGNVIDNTGYAQARQAKALTCHCGKVAKSQFGLMAHQRSHKT